MLHQKKKKEMKMIKRNFFDEKQRSNAKTSMCKEK